MRKLLLIVLVASMFVGCGYELKPKGEVEKITTVHILDIGSFQVDGDVEWFSNGRIAFTEKNGLEISTHIQRCVIVTAVKKSAPTQVKAPVNPTVQAPKKVPEKKELKK